jgi:hypothetical protein
MRPRARSVLLLAVLISACWRTLAAQDSGKNARPNASFWQAAAGIATINSITWAYNRYVQRWPWAKVGTQSWGRNLRNGLVWDNDNLLDDQLAHPFHGSLYHSSARASGFGFWGSVPIVAAGSASWELFGENITASLNDLINTSLGGVAIGEVTYRLSSLLSSKRSGGVGREVGAFALSPVGRTQSLFRSSQPVDGMVQLPDAMSSVSFGRRADHPFFQLAVRYGTAFSMEALRPYDAFEFRLQVSPLPGSGAVREVAISGLLARTPLGGTRTVLGLFQHYDYENLSSFKLSEQSLSGALLYQQRLGSRNRIELGAHVEGVLLGAISSDRGFFWRRDYDLGPGAGARINAILVRDGHERLRLESRVMWLHSVHGSDGEHVVTLLRAGASVPLLGPLGLGGDLALASRHSTYPGFPSVTRRVPEMRGYVTWSR